MRISGFDGIYRSPDIDTSKEIHNVALLLARISSRLKSLTISGDLLEPKEFLRIAWPNLLQFTLADHPTIPFIPITQLVTHMPMLRSLSALHTTDFTKNPRPPFTFGIHSGPFLTETCPHLTSVSLSNFGISDPLFLQLVPNSLDELHLMAIRDSYKRGQRRPDRRDRITTPLNIDDAIALVGILPQFDRLQKLTIILDYILMQPEFVVALASKFRHLTSLHLIQTLERAVYHIPLIDDRNPEMIDALRLFPSLHELKITLDDLNNPCRGVPNQAAYQLFRCLPKLQTVGMVWKVSAHEEADFWNYWHRSMLLDPEPEPLPEYFEYIRGRS
ncbi:hypothetical protein MIND_00586900 [Mycena indigotica]|uniref:Uncharacterized protein n=1 Tax=Mycena indigotica TaxID=2126181 RepID=A0A8H6SQC2_9AGAR|nr:uncharacterized protein MIND_00586900 [Mycena indigotica]KAF7303576.1 hypothetical protein MIND_00586900 [Mycena indigotica]